MEYATFFQTATGGLAAFPFQVRLATDPELPDVLEAPTGAGKTAGVVLAWLWRRRFGSEATRAATPRRLVYCLPMRTLVEQTTGAIESWLTHLGLADEVGLHALLGGAVDQRWEEAPDRDVILVGTQDQLLSRALNRGYAMSRYRWPVHFALLNNDCLWVLDEVQLMGVGLSTTAQLQAFRDRWGTFGPARSLWMSATLDEGRLRTVDFGDRSLTRLALTGTDFANLELARRLRAPKRLGRAEGVAYDPGRIRDLADEIAAAHVPGTPTLVVLNRVDRAQQVFTALARRRDDVRLLHARFRPADRHRIQREILECGWSGILVATQAIEAGIDFSARTLFTELAPWSSLVQRFGRCNRRGEWGHDAVARWIDLPDDEAAALPYTVADLAAARARLIELDDAGIERLRAVVDPPRAPAGPVLRARDLRELFDTTPDLAGHDIDVSPYIRDALDADVQIAWRDWEGEEPPADAPALQRDELCAVPVGRARLFLRRRGAAWRWDPLDRRWSAADTDRLVPGTTLLVRTAAGGYDPALGWTGDAEHRPPEVPAADIAADDDDADLLTYGCERFVALREHAIDVAEEMDWLAASLGGDLPWPSLRRAARWHDLGKAHPVFQEMLSSGLSAGDPRRDGGPWAKSDGRRGRRSARPHFRHELASALALLAHGGTDLEAYLVAAHHGKVRLAIRSRPGERRPDLPGRRFALSIWDGDELPEVDLGDGVQAPATELRLDPMELGLSGEPSWAERALGLLEQHGPFRLAMMEALVRIADWHGTARHRPDAEVDDA